MQAAHGELEGRIQDLTAQLEEAQAAAASPGQLILASNLVWHPCMSALHGVFPTLQQTEQIINYSQVLSDLSKH